MARLAAGVRKRADGKLEKRFNVNGERFSVYGATNKELTEKEQEIRNKLLNGTLEKVVKLQDGKRATIYGHSKAELKEQEERLLSGSIISYDGVTLDDYFKGWIKEKKLKLKSSTIYKYTNEYDTYIKPYFGDHKIESITKAQVKMWWMKLNNMSELAPGSVNKEMILFRNILNTAVDDEIIEKNPGDRIELAKVRTKATDTHHRALTKAEQTTFMNEAKGTYYYELIAFLINTGLRFGEATVLQWSDIDYEKNLIHITKTATTDENGSIIGSTPKSEAGKRDISLTGRVREILASQKEKQKIVSLKMHNYVFVSVQDAYICNSSFNRAIRDICASLEEKGKHIDHFTAHALRDTYATRFIEGGGNPKILQRILGHSTIRMTMDLYAQVLPDAMQEEVNRVNIAI